MRQHSNRRGQAQSTGRLWHFAKLYSDQHKKPSDPTREGWQLTKALFDCTGRKDANLDFGSDSRVTAATGDVGQFAW
jgi:hypothetical protein